MNYYCSRRCARRTTAARSTATRCACSTSSGWRSRRRSSSTPPVLFSHFLSFPPFLKTRQHLQPLHSNRASWARPAPFPAPTARQVHSTFWLVIIGSLNNFASIFLGGAMIPHAYARPPMPYPGAPPVGFVPPPMPPAAMAYTTGYVAPTRPAVPPQWGGSLMMF